MLQGIAHAPASYEVEASMWSKIERCVGNRFSGHGVKQIKNRLFGCNGKPAVPYTCWQHSSSVVLQTHYKQELGSIVLPKSDVKLKQAEKDAVRETFIVNGKAVEQDFWQTENEIAESILSISAMTRQQAQACAMKVFCITNRTCSGAESFFVMTQLFETPNVIIKCRSAPAPTRIDLSKGKNRVIVKTQMSFPYGLYKKSEVDNARKQPRVWLRVDAVVNGEIRFAMWKSDKEIDKKGNEKNRASGAGLSGISTVSQKTLKLSPAEAVPLPSMHDDADEVF